MLPALNDLKCILWRKFDDILLPPNRKMKKNCKYSRTYNDNNIITMDTETTSIIEKDFKCGFVYIAMICINKHCYSTRNLQELKEFLDMYNNPDAIQVIYIHNLSFDFAFIQNVIPFDSVFARTSHKPIYARYKNWEFRCSYFLSQMSLANVGKYYDLPHAKYINGLNYRKRRHTETELSEIEDDYCVLDILVLYDYIEYELKRNGEKYRNIPYTQTGYVRRFILDNAKQDKEYYSLRSIVDRTRPNLHLYEIFEKCYTGGYTHANFKAVLGGLYTHVKSYDLTSSYPAVMCRCMFPMGRFKEIVKNCDFYLKQPEKYCCVGKFRLTEVHAKTDLCYISQHKIVKGTLKNGAISNGRLYYADSLEIYLTNVDVITVQEMYNCKIEVLEMWAATAGYLPKTIVKSVLELYGNKTKLKGIEDQKPLYLASKQMVNSVYGMSVFNPFCDDIIYSSGEWLMDEATPEKLWKYYDNRKTILPYQWGVFVTAHARRVLTNVASKIIDKNGITKVLYMDTDSIKFIGDFDHIFDDDNKKIHDENIKAAAHFGLDMDNFAPVDIKGNSHELGLWDFEHEYKSFKVLGAKRYCYTLPGCADIFPVVAGCPTAAMREYLKLHNCNALLKPFKLNIVLDSSESGKNTVHYHQNLNTDIIVTDYTGKQHIEHIGFGVCLEPATFDMSLCDDYLEFLEGVAVCDKKAMIRNGVIAE